MTDADLARRVEDVVLGTSGVRAVYRPGSLVGNLVDAGATALGIRPDSAPVVAVTEVDGSVIVEASVGVDDSRPAQVVLGEVRLAVERVLAVAGMRAERLLLTVAHVQARESS